MSSTDLQLKNASAIAYQDLQIPYNQLVDAGRKPPFTISELCKQWGKEVDQVFPDTKGQDVGNWKIVDYYDTNRGTPNDTGFYGCVIETDEGNAILAFRGSEDPTVFSNLKNDWIEADLRLMNNSLTAQQGEVYQFLTQVAKSDYIDHYDTIDMTGHSLGGNLAMHGSVVSAMPEIGLSDKLGRCVSYDGPGYSDEYIATYGPYIEQVRGKITHYRWSPVGNMLHEMPGVPRITLKCAEKSDFLYRLITRHQLESVEFEGETAIRGEEKTWDILVGKFSQGVDRMPSEMGDALVSTITALVYSGMWMSEEMFQDGEITPFGVSVLASAAAFVVTVGPVETVSLAASVLFHVALTFVATVAFECVYEWIESIMTTAAEFVKAANEWLNEKSKELDAFIAKGVEDIKNYLKCNCRSGSQYATDNPQICVDPYKLKAYAQRLQSVNNRISGLDGRMDSLYWRVGLVGLWNLIQADMLTGYSWRLSRCVNYLNETASDFEEVENKLMKLL